MKPPHGWEPPYVICPECGTYYPDMGQYVRCESSPCGGILPTGEEHWKDADGDDYPDEWAVYERYQSEL